MLRDMMSEPVKGEVGFAPGACLPWDNRSARRVGVLINPESGANREGLQALRHVLDQYKPAIHRYVVGQASVAGALAAMAAQHVDVLAVCGGDGTVQAVLTALLHNGPFTVLPSLALIAGGTSNMTAADVGVRGKPTRALRRLFAWSEGRGPTGRVVRRAIIRVDGGAGSTPQFGMFFSAAGIVEVTRARWETRRQARSKPMRGAPGTAITVGRYLLGLALGRQVVAPTPITIRLDGRSHSVKNYLALFITTLERLNPGIRPYWGEGHGPLRYTAVAYQPRNLLLAAPSLIRGRASRYLTPESGYTSGNIHEAVLQLQTECALDGEIVRRVTARALAVTYGGEVNFVRV
ncbi:lipid kinase YegS [Candidatus Methylomirabilis lanthanidiphila]|uniref:Lipid kinase YegS n=1 Tax=Candidatus Methylomirabilis lanthanidiphila TaxID=2211376 RepID=A0A564ZL97_9BACT|nr:lipid kinase YegS [Candidatus Methylomirabilis lanthanidiphila]